MLKGVTQSIKKTGKVCGATLLLHLPAGCIPAGAVLLTPEKVQQVQDGLDGIAEHVALLKDTVSRGRGDVFTENSDTTAGSALLAEWEESFNTGDQMLQEGRFYSFPKGYTVDDDAKAELGGLAVIKLKDKNDVILLSDELFEDGGEVQFDLPPVTAHEIAHLTHNQRHDNDINKEAEAGYGISLDESIEHKDFAYRDSFLIILLEQMNQLGGTNRPPNVFDQSGPAYIQYYFDSRFDAYVDYKKLVQQDPRQWAEQYADLHYNGAKGTDNEVTRLEYYQMDIPSGLGNTLQELEVEQEAFVEILLLPSAAFIREQAVEFANENMRELATEFPDLYNEYLRERREEMKVEPRTTRLPMR